MRIAFGKLILPVTLSLVLAACSSDRMLPPGDIDSATSVGSIQPLASPVEPADPVAYAGSGPPVSDTNISAEPMAQPDLSVNGEAAQTQITDEQPTSDIALVSQGGGVNMDEGLGVAPRPGRRASR